MLAGVWRGADAGSEAPCYVGFWLTSTHYPASEAG